MYYKTKLPTPEEIKAESSVDRKTIKRRQRIISSIKNVLSQSTKKKLLIIGPCSADNEDAVIEYVYRLAGLQEKVKDKFVIIPRIYTSKPRTKGYGYKGLLHRPDIYSSHDDIISGVLAMRHLHLRTVNETGMFSADEMLYPEIINYTNDLLVYTVVGTRSVENQQHRLLSSGLNIPVGMKNPLSGSFDQMLNAVLTAQNPHNMLFCGWEVITEGNKYSHCILRGYLDTCGRSRPNYSFENLVELYDKYIEYNLVNNAVIVDCNHSNSKKRYLEQIRIAKDVFSSCRIDESINGFVKGLMIESYIEDGSQLIGNGVFGQSITDPCLGWEKTEKLVYELSDMI